MKLGYKRLTCVGMGLLMAAAVIVTPVLLSTNTNAKDELKCGILPQSICDPAKNKPEPGQVKDTAVWRLLLMVVNIMTAGISILAIGGLIYGAVMYTSAGDNQGQLAKSKEIIRNVVIGIVAFAFMYSFLQWLIPGGVFN